MSPWLVTPDELLNPEDVELTCAIGGELVQRGRSRDLIFGVPQLIARLSAALLLLPGDVIYTGTPAGAGMGRKPQHFLHPGEMLTSSITGIGELSQTFTSPRS